MACPQDSSFGPGSTCRGLDFTGAFEHGILSVAPDTIFLLLSFVRLAYLAPLPPATNRSGWSFALLGGKTASALFVVGTTIAALAGLRRQLFSGELGLAAGVLQVLSAVLLVVLVVFEHLRSIVPSTLVIVYTFVKVLCSGAILHSAILIGSNSDAVVLLGLMCAAYGLLLIAEILGKGQGALEKHAPFMSTTSFVSRPLFHWLIPLMWTGRRKKLTVEDCGEIPFEMRAKESADPLHAALMRTPRTTSHYLVKSALRAFPILLLAPVLPRFLLILATLAQPLLVLRMITFISSSSSDDQHGWALVGGYVVTYAMIYLLTATSWERVFNSTVRFRGALVGNIYRKTLRLSSAAGREVGGGVASTYMSVDVERICLGLETLHEFWAAFVTIILAVALLWTRVTWPAILPLIITLIFTLLTNRISRGVGTMQKAWLGSTDKRVKYLSSVFNHFMASKLSAYEDVVEIRAGELRKAELSSILKYYQLSYIIALITVSPNACLLGVLAAYTALAVHKHDATAVDAANLFTIVTIVLVLAVPFTMIGTGYSSLMTAYASMKRVEKYLLMEERENENAPLEKGRDSEGEDEKERAESLEPGKISVEGAAFAWAADKDAFLKDVKASLETGTLTVCAGPVASGKSMFILSLLRETAFLPSGKLNVPLGRIAYAAQDPLIIPGTIRENILFGREFEDGWYASVLDACALNRDLGELSGGDGTMVGEKGTSLSGGQRQRVALARTVYARAPWTFLDDPFSSLDGHTERHVASALFGTNGLLRGTSVLLVTGNYQHMQYAEQVLTFDTGSIKSLRSSAEIQASYHFTSGADEEPAQASTQHAAETKPHKAQKEASEKPIAQSSLGWTPYLFYVQMTGLRLGICILVLMVTIGLIRIGALVYVQQWSNSGGRQIGAWIGGYAAVAVAVFGLTKLGVFGYMYLGNRSIAQNLHQTELRGLMGTLPTFMTTTAPGQMLSRFSQDIFVADGELVINVVNVIMSATVIIGYVIFICVAGPWISLIIPVLSGVYYLMLSVYVKSANQFQALTAASKSPLYTNFSSTISGLATIRALAVESYFQQKHDDILDKSQVPYYWRYASVRMLRSFLVFTTFLIATALTILAVGVRHLTDPSVLGLALASLTSLTGQLNVLLLNLTGIENSAVSLSRIHEIANLPQEKDGKTNDDGHLEKRDARGRIEFRDVSLRYGEELPQVVKNVSFTVDSGKKIAICGRSGSGKSSLILALFRAIDPSLISGKILLDDIDTQTISLRKLRHSFSLVFQTPFIWQAPLRHNLDPRHLHTDSDIWLALERVGMSDAVSALTDKLESVLEDGGSLSSGQRQLLCLARILLRRGDVIVLDEASSSLDTETDAKIREVVQTDLRSATVITVAHRIETIVDYDTVLVMDSGKVVEIGAPAELLARPGGRFAALAQSQGVVGN